ncbi:DUF5104 domain-containing protein [Lancefieldella rimae]|uniref:DUF5104 domain-containing protein n=1 Tax=Lancefieldella rimae TaxID=1383 RepID=UPI0028ED33DF|nr:DUF5104 domain-containing protein [Lancefieldella rimae]
MYTHTLNKTSIIVLLLTAVFSILIALSGCRINSGHGPRSTMWDKDASAACLEEVSQLIRNSDADGLVAAFSEEARSNDPELATKAEKVISLMGGGTLEESYFGEREGNIPSGSIRVISMATVVAPDGTKWQIHITDCTYDRDDPSRVGIRELQVIPYSDWDAPKGFGWHTTGLDSPAGIRLITSWEGWDPYTSPYTW